MTLCSGIGAPELAAPWVDWRFASEIEAFPRAVLQHRFSYKEPEDHNQGEPLLWGDMTEVTPDLLRAHGIPLPDLIVAGTPCQDFSIAGLRAGTDGERGNLTLKFVEIVHAIVDARPDGKLAVLWENVPGILSDKGNAFGNFLGGLVGGNDPCLPGDRPARGKSSDFWTWHKGGDIELLDDEGEPTGETETVEPHHRPKWPGVGMVAGPIGRAAWATLDAQWFGVAQRRRRVFVVVDFGGSIDPAKVLFEPRSLCGPAPTRQETREGTFQDVAHSLRAPGKAGLSEDSDNDVADALSARTAAGGGLGTDFECDGGVVARPNSMTVQGHHGPIAGTVSSKWAKGTGGPSGDETQNLVAFDCKGTQVQHDDEIFPPLTADADKGDQDPVLWSIMPQNSGKDYKARAVDVAQPLMAGGPAGGNQGGDYVQMGPFVRRITPVECARLQGFPDDHCHIPMQRKRKLEADELEYLRSLTHQSLAVRLGVDPSTLPPLSDEELSKIAADGPQYKAYGNSKARPVVKWIMDRIKEYAQ